MGRIGLGIIAALLILGCADEARIVDIDTSTQQLYVRVESSHSNVNFVNKVDENKFLNAFIYDTYLNGAGVGMLDINNDGLEDLYFAGNLVRNRLYLNKGNMVFQDVTQMARVGTEGSWSGGVTIADVNGDGWDDIYVCNYMYDDAGKRANLFYENQGNGTFKEKAKTYGIADTGYSMMATFFDYDKDGDLDLYVGNQPPSSIYERKKYKNLIDYRFTDRLYRNDNGKFTDVTREAGITNFAYALSVTACDLNNDGWVDIYVANDYEEPDHMYINQGDGTFVNVVHDALRHMSNFSMGVDIADINNDGWQDIFVADMVAKDHYRNKANMSGMNPEKFWNLANAGYHFQYMFNALQLNNGNGTYSEIGQMAGISHTDWSWATLFFDMDNDGNRDLLVTNGQLRDTRNSDFVAKRKEAVANLDPNKDTHELLLEIIQMAPQTKLANYAFRNEGDLTFSNQQSNWGFETPTWSNGAAYGDLDNDGDLDIVINNINDEVFIYESMVNDLKINNYLAIKIDGPGANTRGLNAIARVRCGEDEQMAELTQVRGYMSSVQDLFHFGLGDNSTIDYVSIEWLDGKLWEKENVRANQTLNVKYAEATGTVKRKTPVQKIFKEVKAQAEIKYVENDYDDYLTEILLPYKLSTLGPVCVKADVNGDGLEDFYLGGSAGSSGQLVIQKPAGQFAPVDMPAFSKDARYEDGGAIFVDIDGDGDLDLYVASGGNEFPAGTSMYQDRLYLNDGNGQFQRSGLLPQITASTGAVMPMDFDKDGDIDFFVGSRQIPQHYGHIPASLLLLNDGSGFQDIATSVLPEEGLLGMVTDVAWEDISGDDVPELVVIGEWMGITPLSWTGDVFEPMNIPSLEGTKGLWNRIMVTDVDGDGDMDIIAGNAGTNIKYKASVDKPFKLFVNDFDQNGSNDVYLGYYDDDDSLYPVRGRQCSSQQMPFVEQKFESYETFANASLSEILEGRLEGSVEHTAETFQSGIFYNSGGGAFNFVPFDNEVQVSPIHAIVMEDFNNDGFRDLFLAGNYYNREIETTRGDAGVGCILLGDANGGHTLIHPSETGILANRDVRNALILNGGSKKTLVIANNDSPMQFYTPSR